MTSKLAHKKQRGFTLIELLIVIAVIAGLVTVGLMTYPGAQKSARDSKRKSDLNQYQTSLEVYANKNSGVYPISATATDPSGSSFCTTTLGATSCPIDSPSTYRYISTGTGTDYVIYATLERQNSGANQYWVVCSNGTKGRVNTSAWTPSSTCPGSLTP